MTLVVAEKQGPHGVLLVITDKDILGKRFEEGKVVLDLSAQFYKGEELPKEEVKNKVRDARHLHLTGKEAVSLGVESDLVETARILWVQGVPHAEAVIE